jgi:hypothetical protein
MDFANREQAAYWNNGTHADDWITYRAEYDRMLEPFTTMILGAAAILTTDRLLGVGCGHAPLLGSPRQAKPSVSTCRGRCWRWPET